MGVLRKCRAEVTFQCPNWDLCNEMLYGGMQAGNNKCRFCVSRGKQTKCLLHDQFLTTNGDGTISKCRECHKGTTGLFGFKLTQVDLTESDNSISTNVDVKQIVKSTADNMQKVIKKLMTDGYPCEMALKAAHDLIVKGGW